jgi:tRNA (guanosine-2'-O-)-methyltransferase
MRSTSPLCRPRGSSTRIVERLPQAMARLPSRHHVPGSNGWSRRTDSGRHRGFTHHTRAPVRPERFQRLRAVLRRRQPDLTVLMDRVHKPHNFSAIVRSCDAVGVLEAHVVPLSEGLSLHHGTSAGTKKWVSVIRHQDVRAAVGHLEEQGFTILAAHPSHDASDYRAVDYTGPTAIVLGAELHGVSEETLALADGTISIPMCGMVHSLNVSVATALILFEARRQREAAGLYDQSRLSEAEFRDRLFEWAYPTIARARRRSGRPYPPLTEKGEIVRED